jgi:O-antigen ligase
VIGARPWAVELEPRAKQTLLVAGGLALAVGVLAAAITPLGLGAGLLGLLGLGLVWWRPSSGLFLFVAVVGTLPFGVIPLPLAGAQLTFVDAVLIATYLAVLARVVGRAVRLELVGPAGVALLAFVGLACVAFVAGGVANPIPPELVRRFGKLLASVLLFFIARALLAQQPARLVRLTRWLLVAAAVQGAIGSLLMLLAPLTQLDLLTRLSAIGYPSADVLRYVPGPNDTYTTQLRAIGTSVDPNVFGGTLMLALVLGIVQWVAPRPVLRRGLLGLLLVPIAAGVVLSLSRASWLGLACGLALAGGLRYRRILVLGLLAALAVLVTPFGQDLVIRFVTGFSTADRATAFRVGEYANAVLLIQRYPLLGIGFGLSPDIDVTAGVSSVYLLVAEQTGLLGLLCYAVALAAIWLRGLRGSARLADPGHQGLRLAYLAALSGGLVTGLLDHYFANLAFPHAVALFWLYAAALSAASTPKTAP